MRGAGSKASNKQLSGAQWRQARSAQSEQDMKGQRTWAVKNGLKLLNRDAEVVRDPSRAHVWESARRPPRSLLGSGRQGGPGVCLP